MSKIVKTCDFCGKEFAAHRVDQHLCSHKCHVAYHHAKLSAERAAKRAALGKKNLAIVKDMGETLLVKCANCGILFTCKKDNTAYARKYCSEQCGEEAGEKRHRERDRIYSSVQPTENGRFPSDGMCSALRDIMRKYPVLSAEEEAELMRQEPEMWQKLLVLHNVRLVFYMGKRWVCRSRFMDADDMIQIGFMALMKAAKEFKPGTCRFFTFGKRVIEHRFKAEMRRSYWMVDAGCDSLNRKVDAVDGDEDRDGELLDFVQHSIVDEFKETSLAEWLEYRDGIDFATRAINGVGRACKNAS